MAVQRCPVRFPPGPAPCACAICPGETCRCCGTVPECTACHSNCRGLSSWTGLGVPGPQRRPGQVGHVRHPGPGSVAPASHLSSAAPCGDGPGYGRMSWSIAATLQTSRIPFSGVCGHECEPGAVPVRQTERTGTDTFPAFRMTVPDLDIHRKIVRRLLTLSSRSVTVAALERNGRRAMRNVRFNAVTRKVVRSP